MPGIAYSQLSYDCSRRAGTPPYPLSCTLYVGVFVIRSFSFNSLRGDGHWGKKEKNKNYFWYSVQGPGRMAQTPQAGTGDSVSRFRRYHCSTVINYNSYFLVGE